MPESCSHFGSSNEQLSPPSLQSHRSNKVSSVTAIGTNVDACMVLGGGGGEGEAKCVIFNFHRPVVQSTNDKT